jgi:hypothetical protein
MARQRLVELPFIRPSMAPLHQPNCHFLLGHSEVPSSASTFTGCLNSSCMKLELKPNLIRNALLSRALDEKLKYGVPHFWYCAWPISRQDVHFMWGHRGKIPEPQFRVAVSIYDKWVVPQLLGLTGPKLRRCVLRRGGCQGCWNQALPNGGHDWRGESVGFGSR